ncbi:MAG: hypothetical protein QOF88_1729, partial [Mycobacterium sp.]|nr:hypothetical protein [Mycobacterium sp.]
MDPALTELLLRSEEDDEDQVVEAIIRLRNPSVDVPGVRVVSRFGSIATCRLAVSSIRDVWAHPGVVSLKAPRSLGPDNETASRSTKLRPTDTRRPPHLPVAGSGVVVAAVDWGLDFDHPNFKNPDGTTRLLALWDQRDDSGDSPEPYGYGKLHTRDQIDRALGTSDPYQALGYQPSRADAGGGTHGTHVLDIAAGNGRAGGPVGMAPKAELVFVDLADRDTGGLANLGGSVRLCEAVDFIARTAGPRPWVINLSIGRHGGPHDGKTLIELALDELLDAAPGRFIAQSTGNYYRAGAHACGVLAEGQSRSIHFVVDPADITDNELEIWYDGRDEFTVQVDPPKGIGPAIALGTRADLADADGRLIGRVHHRARDPNNGDNHIDVFLYEPGPFGVWTVTLSAKHSEHGRFDAWLERDEKCPGCQTRFITNDRNPTTTTGTIANSHLPLIVGAYDAHRQDRPVARFSSSGPTRDGRRKPDIAAPGVAVLAARSAPRGASQSTGGHTRKSGSSMATPHVTGAIALCLQIAGHRWTARGIRRLVLGTADPARAQRNRIGRGYLNIPALIAAAQRTRSLTAPDTREESTMASAADAHDTLTSAPATAYREMLYRADGPLSTAIGGHYAIVARPGERAAAPPARGDVLVTVTLGKAGGGRCDVLLDGQLRRRGWYAMTSRGTVQGRLRRILDARGCVPPGHLLLRPLRSYGDAPPNESESVPGPCPDVAVPPSSRPKLLYRNSTHPAVREAQRKLNAFHATRIAAGLPGLDAAPLVDDCIFGENTEKALKSFQRIVFPGQPKQHDRILGPLTWA